MPTIQPSIDERTLRDNQALVETLLSSMLPDDEIPTLIAQVLAKGGVASTQAIRLLSNSRVITAIDAREALQLLAAIDDAALTDADIRNLTTAMQTAPEPIRQEFEQEMQLFARGFNDYVPLGSHVPIGTRRSLVVLTIVSTVLTRSPTRRHKIHS